MRVGVPRHFRVAVPEAAGDLLHVDPVIVGMAEIVDADMRQVCRLCKGFVHVLNHGVAERTIVAADQILLGKSFTLLVLSGRKEQQDSSQK